MAVNRALISVSNKEGIVDFAKGLSELGVEIISTGGTAKSLMDAGVNVIPISKVTGFPEMLEGRVKTLHPAIHGGILADRRKKAHLDQLTKAGYIPIDLVVVNLYPFKETVAKEGVTLDEAIEKIDIGGPTMIRSAAKNFESVAVVVNPSHYSLVLDELKSANEISRDIRLMLATEAFNHTSSYDTAIYNYLQPNKDMPVDLKLEFLKIQDLRYGENPHQKAAYYRDLTAPEHSLASAKQLHGKELSFNNILDLDAAWALACEFSVPAASIIKHTNPCGMAIGNTILEAYEDAYNTDPVSAFGSVVGLNKVVDTELAKKIAGTYVEAVIAPAFLEEAMEVLTKKEGIRLMVIGEEREPNFPMKDIRRVDGGILYQDADRDSDLREGMKVVTKTKPTEEQWEDLLFGWRVCKHVKSNSIVLAKNHTTRGVGAGQMSRVDATELAIHKADKKQLNGAALASDAFFPFRDGIDLAAKAGIKSIIQPGGSMRDEEVIKACDEQGIAMVFTGTRHFKH
ncbi:MAG: bifunctional phosphoribosylaminoimidazolecarboxamide formyltransferase/IMP cyclohydrolase PurH [Actinobacteria bacterium]|nr:MAG: bifunctional phosphoribosylaminoimidazolecarboxamide formyltransferase/IMP cyclohydrolase PurH [Actinomycetota bacterium]